MVLRLSLDSGNKRERFEATALPLMRSTYNSALRLSRDPAEASDLTQETYLRAFRTFENFRPGTNCKAWLFKILYSVFVNKYRKSKRDPQIVPIEGPVEERLTKSMASDPARREIEAPSAEVNEALSGLPEAYRTAILMVDVEELTYEEAAEVLECPVGTVRSRLFRGRTLLFESLQEYARKRGYLKST